MCTSVCVCHISLHNCNWHFFPSISYTSSSVSFSSYSRAFKYTLFGAFWPLNEKLLGYIVPTTPTSLPTSSTTSSTPFSFSPSPCAIYLPFLVHCFCFFCFLRLLFASLKILLVAIVLSLILALLSNSNDNLCALDKLETSILYPLSTWNKVLYV